MTTSSDRPALRLLRIADPAGAWQALGFAVQDGALELGGVRVELERKGRGIVSWGVSGIEPVKSIDGLATEVLAPGRAAPSQHDNGAVGLDHVVVSTPDFDRTAAALAAAGLELRRVRELPGGGRQGFRRLGPAIVELVEDASADRARPAGFWGLVVVVRDLADLAERLGPDLGRVKPAVQPGRQIATLRGSAGLTPAVAFMTPE